MPLLEDTSAPKHARPTGIHWVRVAFVLSILLAVLCVAVGLIFADRHLVATAVDGEVTPHYGIVGILLIIGDVVVARDAIRASL